MGTGAEDYTNEVTIQGQDEDGNPVTVQVTAAGIMQAVMQGMYDSTLKTIQTDEAGRMSTLLYGMYGAEPTVVAVDATGRLSFSDMDQAAINPDLDELLTWTDPLTTLISNLNRLRWSIVQITGEAWGTVTHEMNDYVLRDGTLALTADWDIGDGWTLKTDNIAARDAAGLTLLNDGGVGISIDDTGKVTIAGAAHNEALNLDGRVFLEDVTAPGTTANRLYSVGGDLYWDGIDLTVVGQWSVSGDDIYYTDGNVGVGTASPSVNIELFDDAQAGDRGFKYTVGGDHPSAGIFEFVKERTTGQTASDEDNIANIFWSFYNDAGTPEKTRGVIIQGVVVDASNGTEDADLLFKEMVGGSLTEVMRLNAGNVGIRTATPGYVLDVNGDFACNDQASVNTDGVGPGLWIGLPSSEYVQIADADPSGGGHGEGWIKVNMSGWNQYIRTWGSAS